MDSNNYVSKVAKDRVSLSDRALKLQTESLNLILTILHEKGKINIEHNYTQFEITLCDDDHRTAWLEGGKWNCRLRDSGLDMLCGLADNLWWKAKDEADAKNEANDNI